LVARTTLAVHRLVFRLQKNAVSANPTYGGARGRLAHELDSRRHALHLHGAPQSRAALTPRVASDWFLNWMCTPEGCRRSRVSDWFYGTILVVVNCCLDCDIW
jgi:hypothetical protein